MKLGLVVNHGRSAAAAFADQLTAAAADRGLGCRMLGPGDDAADIDLVVAVGGDGTVLDAARTAFRIDVPVLGFNMGTIGFLAEAEPDELETALDRLVAGEYRVEQRSTLKARLENGAEAVGLNDVVVEKIESQTARRARRSGERRRLSDPSCRRRRARHVDRVHRLCLLGWWTARRSCTRHAAVHARCAAFALQPDPGATARCHDHHPCGGRSLGPHQRGRFRDRRSARRRNRDRHPW